MGGVLDVRGQSVRGPISSSLSTEDHLDVEPDSKARERVVRVMESYPLEDLWWPKMLLDHIEVDNMLMPGSNGGEPVDDSPQP